jgi:polyisoprenoid-binding protein YceI
MSIRTPALAVALTLASWLAADRDARAADMFAADPVHSSVVFRVKHMNTSYFWGRFNDISGSFALDEADPSQSKFQFQVKAGSIDSGNAKRDQHLKSPDFFNAVQFPVIAFKSTGVVKSGTGYEVTGDLTLHGVTKPITARVTPTGTGNAGGRQIAGIEATLNVKQSEFGMTKMIGPVGDDVSVTVSIEARKQ